MWVFASGIGKGVCAQVCERARKDDVNCACVCARVRASEYVRVRASESVCVRASESVCVRVRASESMCVRVRASVRFHRFSAAIISSSVWSAMYLCAFKRASG